MEFYELNESFSDPEECDESILDKSFFWLKTHGYWSIDFETKNGYCFSMYSNDMDPSKNPEVGDNWEYIDNIVAEVVKNIKAKKKAAAAAAKRAARE